MEIRAEKTQGYVTVPVEIYDEMGGRPTLGEMLLSSIKAQDEFAMLPVEEQQRLTREREELYESERCDACGCHPAEHGDG